MANERNYIIFSVSELGAIDFDHVLESDASTVRLSADGRKTFVKWDGSMPHCVQALSTREGPYTHEEMLAILDTAEWGPPVAEA